MGVQTLLCQKWGVLVPKYRQLLGRHGGKGWGSSRFYGRVVGVFCVLSLGRLLAHFLPELFHLVVCVVCVLC